jgi:hypothetical protein
VSDRRKDRQASSGSKQIFFFSPYNVFSVVAFGKFIYYYTFFE